MTYLQQAVYVRSKTKPNKKTRNRAVPKTHHEIDSSPATATTSRRHAAKHVPRVSPYSPASIDPGFVEIGLVQLSQSVKTTNVTHTYTDYIMAPCTHPGTRIQVIEARRPYTCSRPCAFEEKKHEITDNSFIVAHTKISTKRRKQFNIFSGRF